MAGARRSRGTVRGRRGAAITPSASYGRARPPSQPATSSRRHASSTAGTRAPAGRGCHRSSMSSRRPASAETANPLPMRLAERRQVRAARRRRAGRRGHVPSEAGDHLVEHEQRAVAVHSSRNPSRKPGAGSTAVAGSRTRQATWPGCSANRRAHGVEVVEPEADREVAQRLRDPRRHGGVPDEPVVGREERLVLADRDQVAPGGRPGQLDGGRGDVGAVLGELDHVASVDRSRNRSAAVDLHRRRGRTKFAAPIEDRGDGLDHAGWACPRRRHAGPSRTRCTRCRRRPRRGCRARAR